MPQVPILMPQLGESITEATIMSLLINVGDTVTVDQDIIEVETNKAVMSVTALCSGTIAEFSAAEGETLPVGTVLGYIEATEEEIELQGLHQMVQQASSDADQPPHIAAMPASAAGSSDDGAHFRTEGEFRENFASRQSNVAGGLPVPMPVRSASYLSPRIKARMDELGITEADLAYITGTGVGGRITIEDFEQFMNYVDGWPSLNASPMRRSVANSMQRTWRRPIASASRPIFMAPIILHRKRQQPEKKPGITLYFVRALALALAESPQCAGYMVGGRILTPKRIDIGIAVQVDDGVMVPVMRGANEYTMEELVEEYNKLVAQARARRLNPEYQGGGIATVTNFGGFGLTNASPMPLPSESLILGVGSVVKEPVWSDEVECFIPVEKANIVASFDHRVVDGGDIGRLMQRIAYFLEHPDVL